MGLICFLCHFHFVGTNVLVWHLRLSHGLYPGKSLCLKCIQRGCCHVFSIFSHFRKHLNSKHAENIESEIETVSDSCDTSDNTQNILKEQLVTLESWYHPLSLLIMCASAIAQLQVAGVGQSINNFV